jgi:hypothetical protein
MLLTKQVDVVNECTYLIDFLDAVVGTIVI